VGAEGGYAATGLSSITVAPGGDAGALEAASHAGIGTELDSAGAGAPDYPGYRTATVPGGYSFQLLGYVVQRLIPRKLFPLTLPPLADPAQGVPDAIRVVKYLKRGEPLLTDTIVTLIREGGRLQLGYPAILDVGQNAAGIAATVGGTSSSNYSLG